MPVSQSASVAHVLVQAPSRSGTGGSPGRPGPAGAEAVAGPGRVHGDCRCRTARRTRCRAAYFAQPPMPSQVPVCPQLAGPWSRQTPRGSGASASIGQQRPSRPVRLQVTQAPLQATLQQTPSAQKPDAHCRRLAGGAVHQLAAAAVHAGLAADALAVGRAGAEAGAGARIAGERRADARRTRLAVAAAVADGRADDRVAVAGAGLAQRVPGYLRQPPAPSHVPSRPQVDAGIVVQVDESRGSSPALRITHVPTASGALQVLHLRCRPGAADAVDAEVLAHSPSHPHASPGPFGVPVVLQTMVVGATDVGAVARRRVGVRLEVADRPVTAVGIRRALLAADAPETTSASSAATAHLPAPSDTNATSCFS